MSTVGLSYHIKEPEIIDSIVIKDTGKYGFGVFACKAFSVGDKLYTIAGEIRHFDDIVDDSWEDHHCYQIDRHTYKVGSSGPDSFTNHSCDPNAGLYSIGDELALAAIRKITPGEEITFDYSTCMDENHSEYNCLCGAPNCRGKIQDFRLLPPEIQNRYLDLGVVMPFIAERFKP